MNIIYKMYISSFICRRYNSCLGVIKLKKMIFGMMLFCTGFIGVISLVIVAAFNPWDYNGISGLRGSLLGTGTMSSFIFFCVIWLTGTVICGYQAYIEK